VHTVVSVIRANGGATRSVWLVRRVLEIFIDGTRTALKHARAIKVPDNDLSQSNNAMSVTASVPLPVVFRGAVSAHGPAGWPRPSVTANPRKGHMKSSSSVALVRLAAALIVLASLPMVACVGPTPIVPSAVIVPDIVTVRIGASQVFTVYHGTVREFTVQGVRAGSACVEIEPSFAVANSVRVIAREVCSGLAYVTADIGSGRTPLIAAISVSAP
jgi:hypothetical protein